MSNRKKYLPSSRLNPVMQAHRIDELKADVNRMQQVLQSVTDSYNKHMEHLSNFAGHNMGNAVQSMYATLINLGEDNPIAKELKSSVDVLNGVLESFKQMVACTHAKDFVINELMVALDTLTRSQCLLYKTSIAFKYDKKDQHKISLPFQSLLQVLHNLVGNSLKAVDRLSTRLIEVETLVEDELLTIMVKDTGVGIATENLNKIFDYRYTTTNGSGIGLYHAKYVIESSLNGKIEVIQNVTPFTTNFKLIIPYHND